MKSYFITATGTNIGKTFVTCAVNKALREQGKKIHSIKPIISGFDPATAEDSDTGLILQSLNKPVTPENVAAISPWRFLHGLSPDMAARRVGKNIDFKEVVAFCKQEKKKAQEFADYFTVEGVGGVMSPITECKTVIDLIAALGLPVVLITGSYLGTLSHTLTAYEALVSRDIPIRRILINETEASPVPLIETEQSISAFVSSDIRIISVPRAPDSTGLWKFVL